MLGDLYVVGGLYLC